MYSIVKTITIISILLSAPAFSGNIFIEECQKPSSPEVQRTIEMLLNNADTTDCQAAYDTLAKQTKWSLERWGLSDLSVLTAFPALERLSLAGNNIKDLSPLTRLPKLSHLNVRDNEVTDISPLAQLEGLERLDVSQNPISDVRIVGAMKALKGFSMSQTMVTTLPITEHNAALKNLIIDSTQITSLDALAFTPNLVHLSLSNTQITDISAVEKLTKLDWLDASFTSVAKLPDTLPANLGTLEIRNTLIEDISAAANLKKLEILAAEESKITTLPDMNLPKLFFMDLSFNGLTSVGVIKTQEPEQDDFIGPWFRFDGNKLTEIAAGSLPEFTRTLEINGNEISDLSFAQNFARIDIISAAKNKISDISMLADIESLEQLHLADNPLGTTIKKTAANCPTDAKSPGVAKWCKGDVDTIDD